jgi:hypothetical protein
MTRHEKELGQQLQQCQQALLESRRENALLRQKIDLLVKRVFGSSSEQLSPGQLELLNSPLKKAGFSQSIYETGCTAHHGGY